MFKNIKAGIIAIMLSLLLIPLTPNPSYAYAKDILNVEVNVNVTSNPDKAKGVQTAKSIREESVDSSQAAEVCYCEVSPTFVDLNDIQLENTPDGGQEYIYHIKSTKKPPMGELDLLFTSNEEYSQVVTLAVVGDPNNECAVLNALIPGKREKEEPTVTPFKDVFECEYEFYDMEVKTKQPFDITMKVEECRAPSDWPC